MKSRSLPELYEVFKQTTSFYFVHEENSLIYVLNFMYDNYFISIHEYVLIMNDINFRVKIRFQEEFDYDMLIRFIENRIEQLK